MSGGGWGGREITTSSASSLYTTHSSLSRRMFFCLPVCLVFLWWGGSECIRSYTHACLSAYMHTYTHIHVYMSVMYLSIACRVVLMYDPSIHPSTTNFICLTWPGLRLDLSSSSFYTPLDSLCSTHPLSQCSPFFSCLSVARRRVMTHVRPPIHGMDVQVAGSAHTRQMKRRGVRHVCRARAASAVWSLPPSLPPSPLPRLSAVCSVLSCPGLVWYGLVWWLVNGCSLD